MGDCDEHQAATTDVCGGGVGGVVPKSTRLKSIILYSTGS